MELILQTCVNSLVASGFFALVAVGLVLVFGVMGIINFAHGELYMVGAYWVWYLFADKHWPFIAAIIISAGIVTVLGLIMERFLFRPMRENPLGGLINSIGVLFILQVLAVKVGGLGLMKNIPPAYPGATEIIHGASISNQRLFALVCSAVLLFAIWLFLTRSKIGWALRAVAQDREAAALQGISIDKISMLAMGLGAGMAGLAGALVAPMTRVEPYMGHPVIITAFIVTIVGGIGSLSGAVLASVLYAFFSTFVTTYFSGTLATMLGLVIMMIVLVVKPTGIMGQKVSE